MNQYWTILFFFNPALESSMSLCFGHLTVHSDPQSQVMSVCESTIWAFIQSLSVPQCAVVSIPDQSDMSVMDELSIYLIE